MFHAAYHTTERTQHAMSAPIRLVRTILRSPRARIVRFAFVGGVATLIQLGLLALFTAAHWEPVRANAVALALASQANFALNALLTWGDTWGTAHGTGLVGARQRLRLVAARWARFMSAILCTTLLNEGLYAIVQRLLTPLLAALLCSAGIAVLNFVIGDRLVFIRSRSNDLKAQGVLP